MSENSELRAKVEALEVGVTFFPEQYLAGFAACQAAVLALLGVQEAPLVRDEDCLPRYFGEEDGGA
jgi:hypothetical protein